MENKHFGFSKKLLEVIVSRCSIIHNSAKWSQVETEIRDTLKDCGIKAKINSFSFNPEIMYTFPVMFPDLDPEKKMILCTGWDGYISINCRGRTEADRKRADLECKLVPIITTGLVKKFENERILEVGQIDAFIDISVLPGFKGCEHFLCLSDEVEDFKEEVLRPFINAEKYKW